MDFLSFILILVFELKGFFLGNLVFLQMYVRFITSYFIVCWNVRLWEEKCGGLELSWIRLERLHFELALII